MLQGGQAKKLLSQTTEMENVHEGGESLNTDDLERLGGFLYLRNGFELHGYLEDTKVNREAASIYCSENAYSNKVVFGREFSIPEPRLDEVTVLFMGMMDVDCLKENNLYRNTNNPKTKDIRRGVDVFKFFTPLVVGQDFQVIDGSQRLRWAKEEKITHLPVIIVDTVGRKSEVLRLILNRSSEFQRWNFKEVEETSDALPNLQPVLEPLGLFADKTLPVSFFSQTMFDYTIDEANDHQATYRQEEGLAVWASYMRALEKKRRAMDGTERMKRREAAAKALKPLFDIEYTDDDVLTRHTADSYLRSVRDKWEEKAAEFTETYDKAVIEAKGAVPVKKRRKSKKVVEDRRAEMRGLTNGGGEKKEA